MASASGAEPLVTAWAKLRASKSQTPPTILRCTARPKDGAARFVRLPCSAFDSSLPSHRSICDAHIYAEVAVMRPIRLRMSHIQFGTTRMHASRHMHGVCSKASRS